MESLHFYVKQLDKLEKATTSFDKEIREFRDRYTKVEGEYRSLSDELRAFLRKIRESKT